MGNVLAAIISYNGKDFLPACIKSCRQSTIEILVIDNHSTDDSLNYLNSLKNIKLIKNTSNLGFTKAANQAIEFAINHNFDFLLLLNQDTEFGAEIISLICQSFEENPLLAIISPMQLNEQNKPEYQFEKNCVDFGIDLTQPKTIEVPFVNAACWLMDLKKIKEIGYLNPIFKNYGSDLNYCHRVINSGYKVGLNLEAKIIHKKNDRDYQNSIIKTIKIHNTYYLAALLNPETNVSFLSIVSVLYKGIIASIIKLNFKKALLNKLTAVFLLLRFTDIRKLKQQITNPK